MKTKVLLALVDGMRPDAVTAAGHPVARDFTEKSLYTLSARTVMPSVTLPCHMSLFHSVPPERHGVLTNVYTPQVRPVEGLCERLAAAGKLCAFYYNWEELRDLTRPGSLAASALYAGCKHGYETANKLVADAACEAAAAPAAPDFIFVYLGWADEAGHNDGWLGGEYMRALRSSWDDLGRLAEIALPRGYTMIVTADHGGHGRSHGSDCDEDMTIPLFIRGEGINAGELGSGVSIMDIAPTVAGLLGASCAPEWEGKPLI